MEQARTCEIVVQMACVCVCVCVSVVVRVDAELDERRVDDVADCEVRIVSESQALLPAGSRGRKRRKVNKMLRLLGSETQLVVLSRDSNIALLFTCMTLSAVMRLRDHWRTWQLRHIVQELFTFLAGYTQSDGSTRTVRVKRLTWPLTDYERCWDSFQGEQTIQS